MNINTLVRFQTNTAQPDKSVGIVISTNNKQKICNILMCNDIITCDWEDLEKLSELRQTC